ncbi:class I SAM-dependent methyltransferase [Mycobacterium sp. Y57]|nr:class I SAM-dependent methyltransferase [Mycolicibacterium xanthum]
MWSGGRYQAVGERIAHIAGQVVDAVGRRRPLPGAEVVDLACGTGAAALAAAARGARVTGVDITPALLAIAGQHDTGNTVTWQTGDAADTGLPAASFDAAVSNMGIIFVEPDRQVAEINRLLKPASVLAFSAWMRDVDNPLHDPVVSVLGPPPATGFTPDQWGDTDVVTDRLAPFYDDIELHHGVHHWEFASMAAALHFLCEESPVHVETFRRVDVATRQRLASAFEVALRPYVVAGGAVAFATPYVVVSAQRA